MKLITWPTTVVIVALLAGLVVLALRGVDTAPYIGLAVAILIGLGIVHNQGEIIHNQGEIKSATNGNMSRLISLMETMAAQLRQLPPLPEPPPNGGDETTVSGG